MTIENKGVYTDGERQKGQIPEYRPDQMITTVSAEGQIDFGMAMKEGAVPEGGLALTGAGAKFIGVAGFSIDGSKENSTTKIIEGYEQYDDAGAVEAGTVVVYVTEAVTPSSPVRVWHTAEANLAGYQIVNFSAVKAGGDASGLANDGTTYTASISVDGTPNAISIVGSASQTFTQVLAEINTDLTGATIAIVDGDLKVTSDSTGDSSTIAITDVDLFATLTDYSAIATAVPGVTDPVADNVSNFCTTATAGKTTLVSGAKFLDSTSGAGLVALELGGLANISTTDDV